MRSRLNPEAGTLHSIERHPQETARQFRCWKIAGDASACAGRSK